MFPRPLIWTRQPPANVPINRAHPLVRKLAYYRNFAEMVAPDRLNHINPEIVDFTHGIGGGGRYGPLRFVNGTGSGGDYYNTEVNTTISGSGKLFSFAILARTTDSDGTFICQRDGNDVKWQYYNDGPTDKWAYRIGGDFVEGANDPRAADGEWHLTGMSSLIHSTTPSHLHYVDGDFFQNFNAINSLGDGAAVPISILHRWTTYSSRTTGYELNGDCALALVWEDRFLTAAEHKSLYLNPWQIFQPMRRFLPVEVPAAPGGLGIPIAAYHYNHNVGARL